MHPDAWFGALFALALLAIVVAGYAAVSRPFPVLARPLSIVIAVAGVGVAVSALHELMFGEGWAGVPLTILQATIGGTLWGLLVAGTVWCIRRALGRRRN